MFGLAHYSMFRYTLDKGRGQYKMQATKQAKLDEALAAIREAALDRSKISGLTHQFYRYPARFSPVFARECIKAFSKPCDIILDPYMGGGTTVVEATVLGRRAIGHDLNSLSIFIASAKTTELSSTDALSVISWATEVVPKLRCNVPVNPKFDRRTKNMSLPTSRWLRKTIALCLETVDGELKTPEAKQFAKCVILNVGQWALNGRKRIPNAGEFRERVVRTTSTMLEGASSFSLAKSAAEHKTFLPILRQGDASSIHSDPVICEQGPVDLVVTSPPYPGIHMLYHRWQVDGRKETDAPYWIASCQDGAGASFYNFADRQRTAEDRYFAKAESTFSSIRRVMRKNAILVQMVAFSEPERQLGRYLNMMAQAGFHEVQEMGENRIWREVPGRRWHAHSKGKIASSKEVVLIHAAS